MTEGSTELKAGSKPGGAPGDRSRGRIQMAVGDVAGAMPGVTAVNRGKARLESSPGPRPEA
jgi:hypothetical protein